MAKRNLWHLSFAQHLRERKPSNFEVFTDIALSTEPQEADILLLRRDDDSPPKQAAQTLLGLWPMLSKHNIVEFKSPTRGFRSSDLIRLYGYGPQYHKLVLQDVGAASQLTLVLVVPNINQALQKELAIMSFEHTSIGTGYGRIDGGAYTIYLVCTDEVSEAERDDFLKIWSHHQPQQFSTKWWWERFAKDDPNMSSTISEIDGFEEMAQKFLRMLTPAQILKAFPLKEILSGVPPEQCVAALSPMDKMLAIPDEVLPCLPESYIQSLPGDVQDALRARIEKSAAAAQSPSMTSP